MGTQKNCHNETVIEHQKHMLKLWITKYLQFYAENICLSKPVFTNRMSIEDSDHADCMGAQADLSLQWAHKSTCNYCYTVDNLY